MMACLHIEREVHAEIIRHPITVAVGVIDLVHSQLLVVILSGRNGSRATGAIIGIQRQAVSAGELIVTHKLEVVRFVIFRWIPVAIVNRTLDALVVLTKEGALVSVAYPSDQLELRLLGFQFHPIGITFGIDDIGF